MPDKTSAAKKTIKRMGSSESFDDDSFTEDNDTVIESPPPSKKKSKTLKTPKTPSSSKKALSKSSHHEPRRLHCSFSPPMMTLNQPFVAFGEIPRCDEEFHWDLDKPEMNGKWWITATKDNNINNELITTIQGVCSGVDLNDAKEKNHRWFICGKGKYIFEQEPLFPDHVLGDIDGAFTEGGVVNKSMKKIHNTAVTRLKSSNDPTLHYKFTLYKLPEGWLASNEFCGNPTTNEVKLEPKKFTGTSSSTSTKSVPYFGLKWKIGLVPESDRRFTKIANALGLASEF